MVHSQELVYVDSSDILDGKLDKVRMLIQELVDFVEANEPTLLAYHIYVDESGKRMSVFQVHADSASLERHMEIGMPIFLKFQGSIDLRRIDLYGQPSQSLREVLDAKAASLGSGGDVVIHSRESGFSRWYTGIPG
jgi:quinol monooxygenase YgiN